MFGDYVYNPDTNQLFSLFSPEKYFEIEHDDGKWYICLIQEPTFLGDKTSYHKRIASYSSFEFASEALRALAEKYSAPSILTEKEIESSKVMETKTEKFRSSGRKYSSINQKKKQFSFDKVSQLFR